MEAFIAKVISGFLRAGTVSHNGTDYIHGEKLGIIYTLISTWEPENVTQTEDGLECNFFHLGMETLHRISVILGEFNLQERTEHPMTHVQPPFQPPSSLAPLQFLTMYRPLLSPLPPTPPRQEQPPSSPAHPEQPPSSPAHLEQPRSSPAQPEEHPSPVHPQQPPLSEGSLQRPSLRVVFHRVDANNYDCVLKDARLIEMAKASRKRKSDDEEEDESSKENKRPKTKG
ncbi:unnamed protein product [Larinioides sclopetarius]